MDNLIYPAYFQVVHRRISSNTHRLCWAFWNSKIVANFSDRSFDITKTIEYYNTSKKQIVYELFCINAGTMGYYLADLKHKKYYYCGTERSDVRSQFLKLGIGREHPQGI
ncbi:MAG: hypothetical protein QNJ63_09580 [Calothrix sp. MO_192.B10]|nr:hypothetical protein [Calothrix sp. MO_192.B10]